MSWTARKLNELGKVSRGRSRHRPRDAAHLYGGPYPFIQTGDVKHASLYVTEHSQTYSEAGLEQSKLWPAGTLCITIAANIADTAILTYEACFPDSVIGFIPDPQKANAKFIKYYFDAALKGRYRQFSQGAAQDNLSQEKLLSLDLMVPDVGEQIKIADKITVFDDLIENNRRRIALLEQSARLLYREWFVRLRFPGHEHMKMVNGVPQGWCSKEISKLFNTTSGGTPSRGNPGYFEGHINWVKTQELDELFIFDTEEHISELALKNSAAKLFPAGTLLVSIYGGANIGRTALLARDSTCNQACVALMPKRKSEDVLFAQKWIQENREYIIGLAQGAAQTNISQQTLKNLLMTVPPNALLDEFNAAIQPLYKQIKNFVQQNVKLHEARNLLLPRLMSGEIEV